MRTYFSSAISLIQKFKGIRIEHVAWEQNLHVDALAGLASVCSALGPRSISFGTIEKPSLELDSLAHEIMNIDLGLSWMYEIVSFLRDDTLVTDKKGGAPSAQQGCSLLVKPRRQALPPIFYRAVLIGGSLEPSSWNPRGIAHRRQWMSFGLLPRAIGG